MRTIARSAGLPVPRVWKFDPPSAVTTDATIESDKFVADLKGDDATLQTLQTLYQPRRDRLLELVSRQPVSVVWPTETGPQDAVVRTVSVTRWQR